MLLPRSVSWLQSFDKYQFQNMKGCFPKNFLSLRPQGPLNIMPNAYLEIDVNEVAYAYI